MNNFINEKTNFPNSQHEDSIRPLAESTMLHTIAPLEEPTFSQQYNAQYDATNCTLAESTILHAKVPKRSSDSDVCITKTPNVNLPIETDPATSSQRPEVSIRSDQRELELLRREKEVLERELHLTKREFLILQQQSRQTNNSSAQPTSYSSTVPSNHSFSYLELNTLVPQYDPGQKGGLKCQQWVQTVNNLQQIYDVTDQMTLLIASSKLCGAAKGWFNSQQFAVTTWIQLKDGLLKAFPSFTDESDVHMRLLRRRKHATESFEQYFYDMLAIASGATFSNQSVIKYIINGIDSVDLKRTLSLNYFENPHELLKHFKWYEEVQEFTSAGQHPKTKDEKATQPYQSGTTSINQHQRGLRKCFNCNEVGHLSMECQKPQRKQRCSVCFKTGHSEQNCDRHHRISRINSNIFHKSAVINGNKIATAFIDTGSEASLIRSSLAAELQTEIEPFRMGLHGIGNGFCISQGQIRVALKVDNVTAEVNLLVVDDDILSEPILVGRDFLDQHHVTLTKTMGKLTLCDARNAGSDCLADDTIALSGTNEEQQLSGSNSGGLAVLKAKRKNDLRRAINATDVNFGKLTDVEVNKLVMLLNDYRDCFAMSIFELGCAKSNEFEITITQNEPIACRPYRVAYSEKATMESLVNELLNVGIIRPSNSSYVSPALLVKKANGEDRMVIDYRRLNARTIKDRHPLPVIEDLLLLLRGHSLFIGLDLASGYYQIPVAEESRKYTAFVTPDGEYEFNRMPFGLSNAPSCFQRVMNNIAKRMRSCRLIVYMDDILLPCKNFSEGMESLTEFLTLIREEGLTLKLKKSFFFKGTINFLGYEVSADGIKPSDRKIAAVSSFPQPENIHQLRQFLGLTSYFRKFVPGHALIAEPLTRLTRKDVKFEWEGAQKQSFEMLKSILTTRPLLTLYDPEQDHELHTDASALGIAGILLQRDKDQELRPIGYFSRQTNNCEKHYHSYELEALAVVESITRFRSYLLGKHFKVVTDCNSLAATISQKNIIPRIARWWLRLLEYDFDVEYRQGKSIQHVDALSRSPLDKPTNIEMASLDVFAVEINSDDWLLTFQLQDPKLSEICRHLQQRTTSIYKDLRKEYEMKDGRLYRKIAGSLRWVVPAAAIWKIMRSCHDEVGHYGIDRTIELLQRDYWFPRMRNKVKSYVASCVECAYFKRPPGKTEGELFCIEKVPVPFHTLHIDHLGPFPKTQKGNTHVLGIIDGFTKYVMLKAVKNVSSAPVVRILEELSMNFGTPVRIISDRGTAFSSREFQKYCNEHDIKHIMTAARTPRANGQIERCNRTLLHALSTMASDSSHWDEQLKAIQWGMNSCRNETTKQTPHNLLLGFQPRDPLGNKVLLALHGDGNAPERFNIDEVRQAAVEAISKSQARQKQRYDQLHKPPHLYKEGDLVLIERPAISTGDSRKLDPRYKGPYIVTALLNHHRYVIEDIPGAQRTQRKFKSVYSADKMKLWCQNLDEDFWTFDEDSEIRDESGSQEGRAVTN